jgi:hypothetical protein
VRLKNNPRPRGSAKAPSSSFSSEQEPLFNPNCSGCCVAWAFPYFCPAQVNGHVGIRRSEIWRSGFYQS